MTEVYAERALVTMQPLGGPASNFHLLNAQLEVIQKTQPVRDATGMMVNREYLSATFKLKGQVVPRELFAVGQSDAHRLALAVLAGDEQAALLLADEVQARHLGLPPKALSVWLYHWHGNIVVLASSLEEARRLASKQLHRDRDVSVVMGTAPDVFDAPVALPFHGSA